MDSFVMNQTCEHPDNFSPEVYDTTNLPVKETAVVIAHTVPLHMHGRKGLRIIEIDGKGVHGGAKLEASEYAVRISQGKHELVCSSDVGHVEGWDLHLTRTFSFNAEKGHTYMLMWKFKQKWPSEIVTFWVEDKDTGEIITGG